MLFWTREAMVVTLDEELHEAQCLANISHRNYQGAEVQSFFGIECNFNQHALSTLAKLFNALGFVEELLWVGGEYASATTKIA